MSELAHLAGDTSVPLLERTIGDDLDATVARVTATATRSSSRSRTSDSPTAELGAEVDRVAKALLARGLDVGDRVGIWSPNGAAWVLVQYATAKVGAILVNINPAYRTHEVQYALDQSGCRMLVAATDFKTSDYRAMVAEVRPSLPEPRAGGVPRHRRLGRARSPARRPSSDDALADASGVARSPTDPINIQYTSGTTGFPKGATLSHRNILNNGFFTGEALRLHRGRPGLHPGALLPLLRDGARQPRRAPPTAPRW